MAAEAIIKKKGSQYYVFSEDGKKKLGGPYKTKGEAVKRLKQVEYFKHHPKKSAEVTGTTSARYIKAGEYLAIDPKAIQRDAGGMFFMAGPDPRENERIGNIAIVHIRGVLDQTKESGGDSYEALLERVTNAMSGGDTGEPPTAIVFRIHCLGGAVAGLNETVFKLQKMKKATGIKLYAYIDELAASAAYALCCACDEIVGPPSSIVGSIGVISQMASQAKADAMAGIEYRIITSGARKADGHAHMPISDAAVAAETERLEVLAQQFFALVQKSRGISAKKIEALEANIFLAEKAVKIGLADDVMSFDDVCLALQGNAMSDTMAVADTGSNAVKSTKGGGNKTDRRAEPKMALKLDALIAKTEASIASEKDPKKLLSLKAALAAYQTANAGMMAASSDDDDEDKDPEDCDDEEDESKSEKAAKKAHMAAKKAEAAKHKAKAAEYRKKAEEAEEMADKCMDDEEDEAEEATMPPMKKDEEEAEEAAAVLQLARKATGKSGKGLSGALAALLSQAEQMPEVIRDVRQMKANDRKQARAAMIQAALEQNRILPREAKTLESKSLDFVESFLGMRTGAVINTNESVLLVPDTKQGASLSAEIQKSIDFAVASCPDGIDKDKFRASLVQKHQEAQQKRLNGRMS
jgi:ClpP class serine protease